MPFLSATLDFNRKLQVTNDKKNKEIIKKNIDLGEPTVLNIIPMQANEYKNPIGIKKRGLGALLAILLLSNTESTLILPNKKYERKKYKEANIIAVLSTNVAEVSVKILQATDKTNANQINISKTTILYMFF